MVRAADACGQWDAPKLVRAGKGLIDPCPFWDDDGRAYVIHAYANSRIGFKSRIGIFPMSADGTHAIGEDKFLFDGTANHPTIEGPKVYKRDGWYYIFAPAGGVATGWPLSIAANASRVANALSANPEGVCKASSTPARCRRSQTL